MKNTLVRWHSSTWTDNTLAASVTGPATDISNTDNVSVHIKVGAGSTGEFFIQGSNIVDQTAVGTGANFYRGPGTNDWVTIPLVDEEGAGTTLAIAGSATQFMVNLPMLAFSFLRVIYTRTSGSGTLNNVWINGKSI